MNTLEIFPAFCTILVLSVCIFKAYFWLTTSNLERSALRFIAERNMIDGAIVSETDVEFAKHGMRIVVDRRKALAVEFADLAFEKFGTLTFNEANKLIVRKFVRDLVAKTGLRTKDRIHVIELAVTMSFVIPDDRVQLDEIESTRAYGGAVKTQFLGRF